MMIDDFVKASICATIVKNQGMKATDLIIEIMEEIHNHPSPNVVKLYEGLTSSDVAKLCDELVQEGRLLRVDFLPPGGKMCEFLLPEKTRIIKYVTEMPVRSAIEDFQKEDK